MSYPKVKAFLEAAGYGGRITVHAEKCDTVAHAAALIGCGEERIAKTMTFLAGDDCDGGRRENRQRPLQGFFPCKSQNGAS